jgi:hypothetical protein
LAKFSTDATDGYLHLTFVERPDSLDYLPEEFTID